MAAKTPDPENKIVEHKEKFLISVALEDTDPNHVVGLVSIKSKGNAHQARYKVEHLMKAFEFLKSLGNAGLEYVYVTVATDVPIVFGTTEAGFAVAPVLER